MPIDLITPSVDRIPVIRRKRVGETFIGMLFDAPTQRDVLKDDKPVLKANGRPKQELILKLIALPGCTMAVGLGTDVEVPEPGSQARAILKGGGFGQWIDADKLLPKRQVGDVITMTTTHGQAYDANGVATGPKLMTQAECDAVPRERTLGMYGDITIRRATPEELAWVAQAEAAYHAAREPVALPPAGADELM
jgi:hypothetical protein